MTHAITVVLKPGYAPIEQYGDVASMTQGAMDRPLRARLRRLLRDHRQDADVVGRAADGRPARAARRIAARAATATAFLRAIDAALAVRPGDRPQNERAVSRPARRRPAARAARAAASAARCGDRDENSAVSQRPLDGARQLDRGARDANRAACGAGAGVRRRPTRRHRRPHAAGRQQPPAPPRRAPTRPARVRRRRCPPPQRRRARRSHRLLAPPGRSAGA